MRSKPSPWAGSPTSSRPAASSTRPCASAAKGASVYERQATCAQSRPMGKIADIFGHAASSTGPCASAAKRRFPSTSAWATCAQSRHHGQDRRRIFQARGQLDNPAHTPRRGASRLRAPGRRARKAVTMDKIADILPRPRPARRSPAHPPRRDASGLRAPGRRAISARGSHQHGDLADATRNTTGSARSGQAAIPRTRPLGTSVPEADQIAALHQARFGRPIARTDDAAG